MDFVIKKSKHLYTSHYRIENALKKPPETQGEFEHHTSPK